MVIKMKQIIIEYLDRYMDRVMDGLITKTIN